MAIVGGALMPKLQAIIIDIGGYAVNDIKFLGIPEINLSFFLPILCFFFSLQDLDLVTIHNQLVILYISKIIIRNEYTIDNEKLFGNLSK